MLCDELSQDEHYLNYYQFIIFIIKESNIYIYFLKMGSDYENKGDNARTRASAFKHLPAVILSIYGGYSRFLFNIGSQVKLFQLKKKFYHGLT